MLIFGEMLVEQVVDFDSANGFAAEERVEGVVADDSLLLGGVLKLVLIDVVGDDGGDVVLRDWIAGVSANRFQKLKEPPGAPPGKLHLFLGPDPFALSERSRIRIRVWSRIHHPTE